MILPLFYLYKLTNLTIDTATKNEMTMVNKSQPHTTTAGSGGGEQGDVKLKCTRI